VFTSLAHGHATSEVISLLLSSPDDDDARAAIANALVISCNGAYAIAIISSWKAFQAAKAAERSNPALWSILGLLGGPALVQRVSQLARKE
jgi:hypothetical protein